MGKHCIIGDEDGVRWGHTEDCGTQDCKDEAICLKDFVRGPAYHALIVSSAFMFLLSIDSILSFTKYGENKTIEEEMEIKRLKEKKKAEAAEYERAGIEELRAQQELATGRGGFLGAVGDAVHKVEHAMHDAKDSAKKTMKSF